MGTVHTTLCERPGLHPPETLGAIPGLLDRVLADLRARGVRCEARVVTLSASA